MPLAAFWLDGLTWSPTSDSRLYNYPPTGQQLAGVAWRYVVYFASFVLAYLWLRGRVAFPVVAISTDRSTQAVVVAAAFPGVRGLLLHRAGRVRGVPQHFLSSLRDGAARLPAELPRLIQQAVGYGEGTLLVSKLGLLGPPVQTVGEPALASCPDGLAGLRGRQRRHAPWVSP